MARYLNKRDLVLARPKAVFTSAETLFPFQRKTIEETFGCPVFDYYGSREIGAIAAECEQHSGYHVSAENVAVECIKDSEQVEEGERGVMLITNLRNFGMPFIRYAIGDVGKPSNEVCNCGRGLPLLESIEGRVSQFMAVYDKNSKQIIPMSTAAPGPISMTLMQVPLESYRIIQESLDRIIIKAVKGEGYSQKHTDFVINHMQEILGTNVKIEFEFLSYLPSLPSGKRSVFVSKINSFQTQ
jgi:phenylacetate-CoA ligase